MLRWFRRVAASTDTIFRRGVGGNKEHLTLPHVLPRSLVCPLWQMYGRRSLMNEILAFCLSSSRYRTVDTTLLLRYTIGE